ncbi:uncharacterized protein [Rutidosis leptorrhynchoides]|uniref:uncharacterized protein n=1 Tax=Rutidosis leptorrhynchoides TaxID=125765 RepID=UPI003A9A33BA
MVRHKLVGAFFGGNIYISAVVVHNEFAVGESLRMKVDFGNGTFSSLFGIIGKPALCDRPDSWTCSLNNDGRYTVKKARELIDHLLLPTSQVKTLWYMFMPRKVNIFLWRFRLDSLPVRWNLSAKGINVSSIVCPSCNNGVEYRDHLFFECDVARDLWHKIRIWLDCDMPQMSSWDSFFTWLEGIRLRPLSKDRIIAVVVTSLWALWRFRNGVVFLDSFCNKSSLFDFIRLITFRWIKHRGHLVSNWNSWLSMPL